MVSRDILPYDNDLDSSFDDSDESEYYPDNKKAKLQTISGKSIPRRKNRDSLSDNSPNERLPTRQPKCFSKNAVMARENRLRKKQYVKDLEIQVTNLKHNNKSLKSILDNQSSVITQLRKELKYMKSVLANSTDISNLLKTINYNTGMSVSSSLDKTLTLKNNCISKSNHIWNDTSIDDYLLPSDVLSEDLGLLFDDPELNINNFENGISPDGKTTDDFSTNYKKLHSNTALKEHNYTVSPGSADDAGVCLHVSKHRVSLEFCPTCSENASKTWNEVD